MSYTLGEIDRQYNKARKLWENINHISEIINKWIIRIVFTLSMYVLGVITYTSIRHINIPDYGYKISIFCVILIACLALLYVCDWVNCKMYNKTVDKLNKLKDEFL